MTDIKSDLFDLNLKDLAHGLLAAAIGTFVSLLIDALHQGSVDWWTLGRGVFIAGLAYLGKSLNTNSQNELFRADPPKKPPADPFLPKAGSPYRGPTTLGAIALLVLVTVPARGDYEAYIAREPSVATVMIPSHGASGTFIATRTGRSWILSCAHMFTDLAMRPSAKMRAKTLKIDGCPQPFAGDRAPARLVAWDYDADLSLIVFEAGPCWYVPVDPEKRDRKSSWSCGYDEMRWPITKKSATVIASDQEAIYTREKPWHGRSGGCLVDADIGRLIGVVQGYESTRGRYVSRERILRFLRANAVQFGASVTWPAQLERTEPRAFGEYLFPPPKC